MRYGANVLGGETEFRVWAPAARHVVLRLQRTRHGTQRDIVMRPEGDGNYAAIEEAGVGDRYFYLVDGSKPVPDPVSRFLPEGVHGPSEVVDPVLFDWRDADWRGRALEDYVCYELHVGTFTAEGTFDAVIERLGYLVDLGVTAIELMPVGAFPGTRNWGYDVASPYAVQASYGGPMGLKRLVDAAHGCGLAVVVDVVYNHLGPEGNYLRLFGPYFTDQHQTPWGEAVNYDQAGSEGVRRYMVENALYWIREYHADGLRLDAVQTIKDDSPRPLPAEIAENVERLEREAGRRVCVIAETDENDARYVRPRNAGGLGLDAVWSDDFHHAVHAWFSGERRGYYQDFGGPEAIVKALHEGFCFQGEPFGFWGGRSRGTAAAGMAAPQHVICIQNHDQVGNRALGERLTQLVPRGARFAAAALLLLAPQTPLLFMGQEYDEPAPFQFFTSHGDPGLGEAVTQGRRGEFKDFTWEEVPDPQDEQTFARSKLNWDFAMKGSNPMLKWYRELIGVRRRVYGSGETLQTTSPRGGRGGETLQATSPRGRGGETLQATSLRACRAELEEGGGVIRMQAPREEPRVLVLASLNPGARFDAEPGWREVLCQDEDGYRVAVYEPV